VTYYTGVLQRAGTTASCRGACRALAVAALGAGLAGACAGRLAPGAAAPVVAFPGGVLWQTPLPAAPAHAPAYDELRAYVALRDRAVVAVDHASGAVAWIAQAAATVAPVRVGGLLVAADGTRAWALDAATGHARWQQTLPAEAARAPVASGSGVLFATRSGEVVLLSLDDGRPAWRTTVGASPVALVAGREGRSYLGFEDGRLTALAGDGSVSWNRALPGTPLSLTPVADRVFVGSADRFLYSLKEKSGAVAWRWRTGGSVTARVAADRRRVYFVSRDAMVRALDRRHGDLRWQRPLRGRAVGAPLLAGDTVIAAGVAPELRGFRIADGAAAGVAPLPGWAVDGPFLAPAAADVPARVIVVTAGGQMLAVGQTVEPPIVPLERVPGRRIVLGARPPAAP